MEVKEIEAVIEGLLFAAGDAVPLDRISEITGVDRKTTRNILSEMISGFQNSGSGLMIREISGKYQFCTKPEYYEYVKKLFEPRQKQGLSQAAFEVLAIVAYNQPVTRARIEQIRGVNSDSAVLKLVERNLVKEVGRMDAPGKPILYGTTDEFLKSFGFRSVGDLPVLDVNGIMTEAKASLQEEMTETAGVIFISGTAPDEE